MQKAVYYTIALFGVLVQHLECEAPEWARTVQERVRPEARAQVDHARPRVVGHAHTNEDRVRAVPHPAREHVRPEQERVHERDRQDGRVLEECDGRKSA